MVTVDGKLLKNMGSVIPSPSKVKDIALGMKGHNIFQQARASLGSICFGVLFMD
jgi:hypothetical protein